MTRDEILALHGRDLDATVCQDVFNKPAAVRDSGLLVEWATSIVVPPYSSDRNAAALVLQEIERRGKQVKRNFVDELCQITSGSSICGFGSDDAFQFLTASPRDICRAALLAVEGHNLP